VSRVLGIRWLDYLNQALLPALVPVVPMTAVIYGVGRFVEPAGIVSTGAAAAAALVTYAAAYLAFGAGDPERQLVRGALANMKNATSLRSRIP
jgi:hypothetical protein